jgi:RNA polymerase sigma factor for flagellar operon FliA
MDDREHPAVDNDVSKDFARTIDIFARSVHRQYPCAEIDDLKQAGLEGWWRAKNTYDASKGTKFRTWAELRIKGAQIDYARRESRAARVRRSVEAVATETLDEVDSGTSSAAERFMMRVSALINGVAADLALVDAAAKTPESAYEEREIALRFAQALTELPPRQKEFLELSLREGLSNNEIAARCGVAKSTVSHARETTRQHLQRRMLDAFDQGIKGDR